MYGEGLASWWGGPGVARNDCLYPWTRCAPIRVTSMSTGLTVTVRPTMYCDCYTGTSDERLVDLDPASLRALGLWDQRSRGLFPITVEPLAGGRTTSTLTLPDTAIASR